MLKVSGIQSFIKKLEKIQDNKERLAVKAMKDACLLVEGKIKQKISESPRGGHTYDWRGAEKGETPDSFRLINGRKVPVKLRSIPHTASAGGEPPATDTGNLIHHVSSEVEQQGSKVIGRVGIIGQGTAGYAAALEFGAPDNNLEPRPFLYNTVIESKEEIREIIKDHVKYKGEKLT